MILLCEKEIEYAKRQKIINIGHIRFELLCEEPEAYLCFIDVV